MSRSFSFSRRHAGITGIFEESKAGLAGAAAGDEDAWGAEEADVWGAEGAEAGETGVSFAALLPSRPRPGPPFDGAARRSGGAYLAP